MVEPLRKFDISWLPKVLPKKSSGATTTPESLKDETVMIRGSHGEGKTNFLAQALREHGGQAYVVDLAKDTNLDFQTALSTVLELTAAGKVKIVKRDPNAADHLVALSNG